MAQIDINQAAEDQIRLLRGIGRISAARIVAARPFISTYDLVTRRIIPEGIFDKIAGELTASPGLRTSCGPGRYRPGSRFGAPQV
jgi:DNA uptake protein ComE-like DNA-binding protein